MKKENLKKVRRVRSKILGSAERPRLAVFRSNMHISAQLIDDEKGLTLVAAIDTELKNEKDSNKAEEVGKLLAQKAKTKKITKAVFDRRFYKYHGKIKKVAESARKEGLKI